jgi:predicted 3-demethylubiquinone-9 3-methyltransferase (glyoxalase superfamily)
MARSSTPFLMFEGTAEDAMPFHALLCGDDESTLSARHVPDGPGGEGTFPQATSRLGSREFRCPDSPVRPAFSFTP